jgi:hypothetical protein
MHKKEQYLEAACKKILGANLIGLNNKIDTDSLGTFSGEVERRGGQIETARLKCQMGLDFSGHYFGLANEGSFGPHPSIPFIPASLETLVFIDRQIGLEIAETRIFMQTNYRQSAFSLADDLMDFLSKSKFPSHALIVRPNIWEDKTVIFKGIQDLIDLKKNIEFCCKKSSDSRAYIETDMRAHMNPTRGRNIHKLGIRLFRRLTRQCPSCASPGWGISGIKKGKLCKICRCPTKIPISYIWSCSLCLHHDFQPVPGGDLFAEPVWCDWCNP